MRIQINLKTSNNNNRYKINRWKTREHHLINKKSKLVKFRQKLSNSRLIKIIKFQRKGKLKDELL